MSNTQVLERVVFKMYRVFKLVEENQRPVAQLESALDAILADTAPLSPPISFLPLVGVAEAAEIIGVSRQRIIQLSATKRFPAPIATLKATRIWDKRAIEEFARNR